MTDVQALLSTKKDVDAFPGAAYMEHDPFADDRMPDFSRINSSGWNQDSPVTTSYSADGALRTMSLGPDRQRRDYGVRGYEAGSVFGVTTVNDEASSVYFAHANGAISTLDPRSLQNVRYGDPQNVGNGFSAKRTVDANGFDSFRVWYNDAPGTPEEGIREGRSINVDLVFQDNKLVPTYINRREGVRSIDLIAESAR